MSTQTSQSLKEQFAKLFMDGKLVDLHICRWSMQQALEKEDINLDNNHRVPQFVQLGSKWLMPADVRQAFSSIEGKARTFLKRNSHKFPIGNTHFVPTKRVEPVLLHLLELKNKYTEVTNTFLTNYEVHKQKMLADYPDDHAALIDSFPTVDYLTNKFKFQTSVYEIAVPTQMEEISLTDIRANNLAEEQAKLRYIAEVDAQYAEQRRLLNEFVTTSVQALRARVLTAFQHIVDKIQSQEPITATNITSINTMISEFTSLDFFNDRAVRDQLDVLSNLLHNQRNYQDNDTAVAALEQSLTAVINVVSTEQAVPVNADKRYFERKLIIN
jgi:hypothetical protein